MKGRVMYVALLMTALVSAMKNSGLAKRVVKMALGLRQPVTLNT
jgi:hypothetical protein